MILYLQIFSDIKAPLFESAEAIFVVVIKIPLKIALTKRCPEIEYRWKNSFCDQSNFAMKKTEGGRK